MKETLAAEPTAADTGSKEYLNEVADKGPSPDQAMFSMAKSLCERLGPNECPFGGQTRDGMCVANWSPCVRDARQPKREDVVAAMQARQKSKSKAEPKTEPKK